MVSTEKLKGSNSLEQVRPIPFIAIQQEEGGEHIPLPQGIQAVSLPIDTYFRRMRKGVDPSQYPNYPFGTTEEEFAKIWEYFEADKKGNITIERGEYVLGHTAWGVQIKDCALHLRRDLVDGPTGRDMLVTTHISAPWLREGDDGKRTFEFWNYSEGPMTINIHTAVAVADVVNLNSPSEHADTRERQFNGQNHGKIIVPSLKVEKPVAPVIYKNGHSANGVNGHHANGVIFKRE